MSEIAPTLPCSNDEPDWSGDDPRIIVRDQAATAVFRDRYDIVIWQRDSLGNDGRIFLTPENARLVAKAILDAAGVEVASASEDMPTSLAKVGSK